jgi:hypothetical protein
MGYTGDVSEFRVSETEGLRQNDEEQLFLGCFISSVTQHFQSQW